jgi:hypothetical protein
LSFLKQSIFDLSRAANVPCAGCVTCCLSAVPARPEWGDDPAAYETAQAVDPHTRAPVLILKQTADGACIYLDGGCSIYERRPTICRAFDCRAFYEATQTVVRHSGLEESATTKLSAALQRVIEAGRLRSLVKHHSKPIVPCSVQQTTTKKGAD